MGGFFIGASFGRLFHGVFKSKYAMFNPKIRRQPNAAKIKL